jgi:hypothetical protein
MMDVGSLLRMYGIPPEQLAQMQSVTSRIKARVHTEANREIRVYLDTDDAEAAQWLPQVTEGLVGSVSQALYQLFGITGERF